MEIERIIETIKIPSTELKETTKVITDLRFYGDLISKNIGDVSLCCKNRYGEETDYKFCNEYYLNFKIEDIVNSAVEVEGVSSENIINMFKLLILEIIKEYDKRVLEVRPECNQEVSISE